MKKAAVLAIVVGNTIFMIAFAINTTHKAKNLWSKTIQTYA